MVSLNISLGFKSRLLSQTKKISKFVVCSWSKCQNRQFLKPYISKVNIQVPITILVKVLRQIKDSWFGTVENGTVVSTVGFSEDRKKLQRPKPSGQLFLVVKFIYITKMPSIRCTVLVTFRMKLLKICNWTDQAIVNILAGWLSSYELEINFHKNFYRLKIAKHPLICCFFMSSKLDKKLVLATNRAKSNKSAGYFHLRVTCNFRNSSRKQFIA